MMRGKPRPNSPLRALIQRGWDALTIAIVAAFLFPYAFMVLSAFKPRLQTFRFADWILRPARWFEGLHLGNFEQILDRFDLNILFYMKNSLIIAVVSTLLTIIIAIPATYSFARFDFRRKEVIAYGFLFLQMVPGISIVFALYFVAQELNLYDTHAFLILVYLLWNIPYAIWMLRGFVSAIPQDLEEAAMVDGASRFTAFRLVTLPLMVGGLAATSILIFIGVWNEFSLAFFLTSLDTRTLPTAIGFFTTHSGIKWGPMFATATLGTLPVVIFALIVRRYFVSALTFGAVKG